MFKQETLPSDTIKYTELKCGILTSSIFHSSKVRTCECRTKKFHEHSHIIIDKVDKMPNPILKGCQKSPIPFWTGGLTVPSQFDRGRQKVPCLKFCHATDFTVWLTAACLSASLLSMTGAVMGGLVGTEGGVLRPLTKPGGDSSRSLLSPPAWLELRLDTEEPADRVTSDSGLDLVLPPGLVSGNALGRTGLSFSSLRKLDRNSRVRSATEGGFSGNGGAGPREPTGWANPDTGEDMAVLTCDLHTLQFSTQEKISNTCQHLLIKTGKIIIYSTLSFHIKDRNNIRDKRKSSRLQQCSLFTRSLGLFIFYVPTHSHYLIIRLIHRKYAADLNETESTAGSYTTHSQAAQGQPWCDLYTSAISTQLVAQKFGFNKHKNLPGPVGEYVCEFLFMLGNLSLQMVILMCWPRDE